MEPTPAPISTIILPIFAGIAILLDLPPLIWHTSNPNIGAAALIFWITLLNLTNFLNPLIWPRNNLTEWWHGQIFCDVQIRVMVGAVYGAIPGCTMCISMTLAGVLDTSRQVVTRDRKERIRGYVLDCVICFGLPVFFMMVYYLVQDGRYYIFQVYGCGYSADHSWVTIAILLIWPCIMDCCSTWFAILVIYRLYTYRTQISTLLTNNKTTRSRFLRLLLLSILILIFSLPFSLYAVTEFMKPDSYSGPLHAYKWSWVHDKWDRAKLVPDNITAPHWDRWLWVFHGYTVFLCFGLGLEARCGYGKCIAAIGLRKVFPSLNQQLGEGNASNQSSSGWFSLGIIQRTLFRKQEWSVGSRKGSLADSFQTTSTTTPTKSSYRFKAWKPWTSTSTVSGLTITNSAPKHIPQEPKHKGWAHYFASMPSFGQAFTGVQRQSRRGTELTGTGLGAMVPSVTLSPLRRVIEGRGKGKGDDAV